MSKKIIFTIIFSLLVSFSFGPLSHANKTLEGEEYTFTFENDVIVNKDTLIGKVEITSIVKSIATPEGTEMHITLQKKYNIFSDYKNEYDTIYVDSSDQSVMLLSNENDLYIDGKKLDTPILEKSLLSTNISPLASNDTGGIPSICHYYSNNAWTNYNFACYESMNYNWFGTGNGHGEPEGSNVQKTGITPSNTWFSSARNDVDLFDNAYSDYRVAYAAVLLEAGVTAITLGWLGPGGLIAAGGMAAILAGTAIYMFNQAVDAEEKAYKTIKKL